MLLETHIQNFCQIHSEIPKLHNKKWQSYSFEARGGRGGGERGGGGGKKFKKIKKN